MNKNYKLKITGILILVLSIVVLISMYYINSSSANTITVYKESVEEKVYAKGFICTESTLISANETGEVLFTCPEGKMIVPYYKIATIYSGVIDDDTRTTLKNLNDKIVYAGANVKNKDNIVGDVPTITREISKSISQAITETNENNYSNIYKIKNEINLYNKKLFELKGEKIEVKEENIEDEIIKVEQSLNLNKTEYKSPVHGMFSTKVTNFDELITPKKVTSLSPDEYDSIYNTKIEEQNDITPGKNFCKIVNNYEWYTVAKFKKEEIEGISEGSFVHLRILNKSDSKIPATVIYISDEEDEEVVVALKSTKHLDNIWVTDKIEFELILRTRSGFKVPPSAIIERGNEYGVYAIKDSVYKFIKVEPVLFEDKFVLLKDKTTEGGSEGENVILYDFVVVNPEHVKEGDFAH